MNSELVEAGWTEDHWNRITSVVTEEAQRARVVAQAIPVIGPADPGAVAFSDFRLTSSASNKNSVAQSRLEIDPIPNHRYSTIAVEVHLTSQDVADPELEGALVKFRRAANIVARLEDAIVCNDRVTRGNPIAGVKGLPPVYRVNGGGPPAGTAVELGLLPAFNELQQVTPTSPRLSVEVDVSADPPDVTEGKRVTRAIIQAMELLESSGQSRPFASVLSPYFYEAVHIVNDSFVSARDRILPILNGPLLRSSAMTSRDVLGKVRPFGCVLALGGSPLSIRLARDIGVRLLQVTNEPRYLFRVSERIGFRVTDPAAIVVLRQKGEAGPKAALPPGEQIKAVDEAIKQHPGDKEAEEKLGKLKADLGKVDDSTGAGTEDS